MIANILSGMCFLKTAVKSLAGKLYLIKAIILKNISIIAREKTKDENLLKNNITNTNIIANAMTSMYILITSYYVFILSY